MGALTAEHVAQLEKSGISEAFAAENGLRSFTAAELSEALHRRGLSTGGLGFPYQGEPKLWNFRLDEPLTDPISPQKKRRYLLPSGARARPYVPALTLQLLSVPGLRRVITEGEKKTLGVLETGYCTIGLTGTSNWSKPQTDEEKAARVPRILHPDLAALDWRDVEVDLVFDSDSKRKRQVLADLILFAIELEKAGAIVRIAAVPDIEGLDKAGVDDHLGRLAPASRLPFLRALLEAARPLAYFAADGQTAIIAIPEFVMGQPERSLLFDGLLPEGSIALFSGSSGIGKSIVAMHLAVMAAQGLPAFGKFECSKPRPVLLIDLDQNVFVAAERWRRMAQLVPAESLPNIERWNLRDFKLSNPTDLARLVSWGHYVQDVHEAPPLIILDTLRSITPLEVSENDSEMGPLIGKLRACSDMKAAIIIIHHTNRQGGARGSTAILGAVDDEWSAKKIDDHYFEIDFTKMRSMERPESIAIKVDFEDFSFAVGDAEERKELSLKEQLYPLVPEGDLISLKDIMLSVSATKSGVCKALRALVSEGKIVHLERKGYTRTPSATQENLGFGATQDRDND